MLVDNFTFLLFLNSIDRLLTKDILGSRIGQLIPNEGIFTLDHYEVNSLIISNPLQNNGTKEKMLVIVVRNHGVLTCRFGFG